MQYVNQIQSLLDKGTSCIKENKIEEAKKFFDKHNILAKEIIKKFFHIAEFREKFEAVFFAHLRKIAESFENVNFQYTSEYFCLMFFNVIPIFKDIMEFIRIKIDMICTNAEKSRITLNHIKKNMEVFLTEKQLNEHKYEIIMDNACVVIAALYIKSNMHRRGVTYFKNLLRRIYDENPSSIYIIEILEIIKEIYKAMKLDDHFHVYFVKVCKMILPYCNNKEGLDRLIKIYSVQYFNFNIQAMFQMENGPHVEQDNIMDFSNLKGFLYHLFNLFNLRKRHQDLLELSVLFKDKEVEFERATLDLISDKLKFPHNSLMGSLICSYQIKIEESKDQLKDENNLLILLLYCHAYENDFPTDIQTEGIKFLNSIIRYIDMGESVSDSIVGKQYSINIFKNMILGIEQDKQDYMGFDNKLLHFKSLLIVLAKGIETSIMGRLIVKEVYNLFLAYPEKIELINNIHKNELEFDRVVTPDNIRIDDVLRYLLFSLRNEGYCHTGVYTFKLFK